MTHKTHSMILSPQAIKRNTTALPQIPTQDGQQATPLRHSTHNPRVECPGQQAIPPPLTTDDYVNGNIGQQATVTAAGASLIGGQQATTSTPGHCPTDIVGTQPTLHTPGSQDHGDIPTSQLPLFLQNIGYPEPPEAKLIKSDNYVVTDDFDLPHTGIGDRHRTNQGDGMYNRASWPFPARVMPQNLADLYDRARDADRMNDQSRRPVIHTTLNIPEWAVRATGHHDDGWILDALEHGFPIQYSGPPKYEPLLIYNHASATAHSQVIKEYIQKETACGALHGPFSEPPFTPWMIISPLMTRQKPDSKERRVIVDLSYPQGGVNAYITQHMFDGRPAAHNLPSVDHAVGVINRLCPGDIHLAVIDLSRAYRQFPVPPTDWPLLGIQFDGQYFYDGRLPFGARLSAFAMQSVASFLTRALKALAITSFMYLDDIIIISGAADQAARHYAQTLAMLDALGLEVAPHKLQPPAKVVTWLGITIDMELNQLSIPAAKLQEVHKCLAAAARLPRITVRHLQSILGYINHLAKVVRAARIFISRLLAALRAAEADTIVITPPVKADLSWFLRYLSIQNAREVVPHNRVVLRIWADSSLRGAGATDGAAYYTYDYPSAVAAAHHITQLEALNVLAAVRTFVNKSHAAGIVQIHGDNMASMSAYTSGRARDSVLAACCRAMWFHAAETHTKLEFTHLPGESMVLPDALSRSSFDPRMRARAGEIIARMALSEVKVKRSSFSYSAFV